MSRAESPPSPQSESSFDFRGSGAALLALRLCQLIAALTAAFFVAMLLLTVLDHLAPKAGQWFHLPRMKLIGSVPGVLLAWIAASEVSEAIRLYRIRHTYVFGQALESKEGCLGFIRPFVNVLITLVTLGLAKPWLAARQVRYDWRCAHFRADPSAHFDHNGPVFDFYVVWVLLLITAPLGGLTLGFVTLALAPLRIRWEQSHILVPGSGGTLHQTRYSGTWTGYIAFALPRFLLTLLTLGIYWPWANVACWRWIAQRTHVPARAGVSQRPPSRARASWKGVAGAVVSLLTCAAFVWGLTYMPDYKLPGPPKPPRKRSVHITLCPLPGSAMPRTESQFVSALQSGLEKIMVAPPGWQPVSARGRAFPEMEQVRIDVSGANITPERKFPKSATTKQSGDEVNIKRMEVVGAPLMYQQAKLTVKMQADNVWLGVEADGDGRPVLVVNEAWDGRLEMAMKLAEIEDAVLLALRPEAQKQGVTLEKVQLSFKAAGPRTLDVQTWLTAKYGLRAKVRMDGRIDIDEQLIAKFTNLHCEGDGAVGSVLAKLANQVLVRYEGAQASLLGTARDNQPLAGVQLRDLVLSTDDGLHVQAGFGEKSKK